MQKVSEHKLRLFRTLLALFVCLSSAPMSSVVAQQRTDATRLNELRRLRDELQLTDSLRQADIVMMIGERAIIEAARQFVGLEIVLANGSTLRITSVDAELKPAAAVVKIGVQARSTITVNLQLTGRLGVGEAGTGPNGGYQLPFQITEVSLMNGRLSSLLLKTLFGEWLGPAKWNEELPSLELPLEISESLDIPVGRFDVEGSLPMEITTPAYHAPLKFAITSFFVLDKRAVLGLQMIDAETAANGRQIIKTSYFGLRDQDQEALENEIAQMTSGLASQDDLRVRLNRRVVSALLEQIAAAHSVDFNLRLKPGRVRSEEVSTVVNTVNYTDVEGGEGRADINQLRIDRIADGKIYLRLSGQGEVDARLKGREYGIPYRLSPRTAFAIKDQTAPLQFVSEGERVVLRAVPGSTLQIDLRFSLKVVGRDVGVNRQLVVQADRWLKQIELPPFFGREISLPRRMEIDAGGNLYTTKRQQLGYTLSGLRLIASEDAIELGAALSFSVK